MAGKQIQNSIEFPTVFSTWTASDWKNAEGKLLVLGLKLGVDDSEDVLAVLDSKELFTREDYVDYAVVELFEVPRKGSLRIPTR